MRILVVVRSLNHGGGISEWVSKYYNDLANRYEDFNCDILVESGQVDMNIDKLNSKIKFIKLPNIKKNPIKYHLKWLKIARKIQKYNYVHFHIDNLVKFYPFLLLKKSNNIIIHSHNSTNNQVNSSNLKRKMHKFGKKIIKKYNFTRFACSDLAAKWLFDDLDYVQINNGINLYEFKFNENLRSNYLKELNLNKNDAIYGHIGRMVYQKNHDKLVEIFNYILKYQPTSKLLLIGQGELELKVKQKILNLGIEKSVIFLGYRSDVKDIINIFDYCIFPSRFEGLPIALVEAQANGIPIFYSDRITKEVELLDESLSFSIDEKSESIAMKIIEQTRKSNIKREESVTILKNKGYEQSDVVEKLYDFYKSN